MELQSWILIRLFESTVQSFASTIDTLNIVKNRIKSILSVIDYGTELQLERRFQTREYHRKQRFLFLWKRRLKMKLDRSCRSHYLRQACYFFHACSEAPQPAKASMRNHWPCSNRFQLPISDLSPILPVPDTNPTFSNNLEPQITSPSKLKWLATGILDRKIQIPLFHFLSDQTALTDAIWKVPFWNLRLCRR